MFSLVIPLLVQDKIKFLEMPLTNLRNIIGIHMTIESFAWLLAFSFIFLLIRIFLNIKL
jgi:hypothetical protein